MFSLDEDVHYLNCAYMSPLMKSVEQAGYLGIAGKKTPYRISPNDFFEAPEALRVEFSNLINAQDPLRIAIIPSVSYGMANVTKSLSPARGKKIVVAGEQFPSNYYPWQRWVSENHGTLIAVSPPSVTEGRGKLWNEKILESIDRETGVVAISHVHWTDGTLFDLEAIREACDANDALLVIDGTQSVGALPFDVQKIRPDALVCAGYKWLMGPYSIGMAYYDEAFDNLQPIEENWINRKESEAFAGLINYKQEYQPGAPRFDVGERSNFILVPMMLEALKQINKWGVGSSQEYAHDLFKGHVKTLKEAGFIIEDQAYRSSHLLGIRTVDRDMAKLTEKLQRNNIHVSTRGSAIRVSLSVFNTKEDVDAFTGVCMTVA